MTQVRSRTRAAAPTATDARRTLNALVADQLQGTYVDIGGRSTLILGVDKRKVGHAVYARAHRHEFYLDALALRPFVSAAAPV